MKRSPTSKAKRKPPSKQLAPVKLAYPALDATWFEEPKLVFAGGAEHSDPKVGVPLYGPSSLSTSRHKSQVHVGFIGTGQSIENAMTFYERCVNGIAGDDSHAPFPGCKPDRGYRCSLCLDSGLTETLTRQDLRELDGIRLRKERFPAFVDLVARKLELLALKDHPLDYVVVVLPPELYSKYRTVDYNEKGVGSIHRDFRRAFKAVAMKHDVPTQLLRETTTGAVRTSDDLDHESVIAWNLFTGLYFKVEGLPWGPTGLGPGTCFIGVSFFRPLGESSTLRTSVVQAFDENGEGLVLRGPSFHWDESRDGKSPHLDEAAAGELIEMVLSQYQRERKQLPSRVVLHKTSKFEERELRSFEDALSPVDRYDLVAVAPVSDVRLIRQGQYPPLRGTCFTAGELSYLYTVGYSHELEGYPHGHVPSALQISQHIGDSSRADIIREILILTKMNWNSANFAGLMPITLRFSQVVGEILREVPSNVIPRKKYKHYM